MPPHNVPSPSAPSETDVVVIGGGVNGTGVARDCALRGLRVALLERNDLAFGASGNSSGMIHGGPRYLTDNPSVTRLSCVDSGFIQRIAPHLLFRIPFIMPIAAGLGSRVYLTLVDAFFGAYDRFQPLKRGKPHTRLTPAETAQIEPGIRMDLAGSITFDEWGIDGSRLCAANAIDAVEHGASVLVHTTVDRILREGPQGAVTGVTFRDRLTGRTGSIRASIVVNATGAWGPVTASLAGLPARAAAVRPGKGIHVVFDRRLSNHAVSVTTIDNRLVFVEPWQNVSVLGTTDTDFYGDLDCVHATADEVRYLVQAVARVMPSIRTARIIGTFAGVRPTLHAWGPIPDALSRENEIVDHAGHGAPGLFHARRQARQLPRLRRADDRSHRACVGLLRHVHDPPASSSRRRRNDRARRVRPRSRHRPGGRSQADLPSRFTRRTHRGALERRRFPLGHRVHLRGDF